MLTRRVLSAGLATLLTVCVAAVASPAAAAAPVTRPGAIPQAVLAAADALAAGSAISVSAAPTFSREVSADGLAVAEDVITCYGQAQYPHGSTGSNGIPGSLDGKVKSWCDAAVPYVGAQVELYQYVPGLGFYIIAIGSLNYGPGPGPYTGTAFGPCTGAPNYYITRGIHTFTGPGGYYPPSLEFYTQTPVVQVTC
jgi:hypothetical protein